MSALVDSLKEKDVQKCLDLRSRLCKCHEVKEGQVQGPVSGDKLKKFDSSHVEEAQKLRSLPSWEELRSLPSWEYLRTKLLYSEKATLSTTMLVS